MNVVEQLQSKEKKINTELFYEKVRICYKILKISNFERRILNFLMVAPEESYTVTDIYIKTRLSDYSTINIVLLKLKKLGYLNSERDSKVVYYSVNYKFISKIKKAVAHIR